MKKQLITLLFTLLSFAAIAQTGSISHSVYKSRVNDTTQAAFIDAIAAAVAAGYSYEFWNNQAATPHTDKYTDAGVEHIFTWKGSGSGAGGHTIEEEGTPLTARSKLNFVGAGVTATDDSGDDATVVTIPSVIGKQQLYVDAAAWYPTASDGASTLSPRVIGNVTVNALKFDQTSAENIQFKWDPPDNWDNGTITIKIHWTSSSGTGTIQWDVSALSIDNDESISSATFGTVVEIDDTLLAVDDEHLTAESGAITISGSPTDLSLVFINIARDPTEDTLDADAEFLGATIELTLDASTSE